MKLRSAVVALALCAAPIPPAVASAQSVAEHIVLGDRERTDAAAATRHFEAALATEPSNYEALWKASLWAVEAGQALSGDAQRAMYKKGEQYARRAIQVTPNDAEGHFVLARALGRTAQSMGKRDKVKFAAEVRTHAMEAIRLNAQHAGALHVMGMWNAEVMRLSSLERFAAKNFLGGKIFESANWKDAQRFLEEAVAIEPTRLVHRIDLAEIYVDRGNKLKAREQIDVILRAPSTQASDGQYKSQAQALEQKLR